MFLNTRQYFEMLKQILENNFKDLNVEQYLKISKDTCKVFENTQKCSKLIKIFENTVNYLTILGNAEKLLQNI